MAKHRVQCPDCGHKFTSNVGGVKTTGVRARRAGQNQFEYQISVPEGVTDIGRFVTVTDDLILTGAMGLALGGVGGFLAGTIAPDLVPQLVGLGASCGVSLAWGWLCAEHNTRLKRVLPWFLARQAQWPRAGGIPVNGGELTLTIDHRYRDSFSEAGRSIALLGVLPVDVGRFYEWATLALRGDSLAIAHWTGAGKLFSRPEYDALLNKMREARIVSNVPGKGNQLTNAGRHTLRAVIKNRPPTPPPERAR